MSQTEIAHELQYQRLQLVMIYNIYATKLKTASENIFYNCADFSFIKSLKLQIDKLHRKVVIYSVF
jgi:hypothetical protein